MKNDFNNIKNLLKQTKLPETQNIEFEHRLRRALLNSSYYSDNVFIRFQRRYGLRAKKIFIPALGTTIIISSIFFINTLKPVNEKSAPTILSTQQKNISTKIITQHANLASQEALNNWYHSGSIKYHRQEQDGSRVYTLQLEDGRHLELRDPNPYIIQLISSTP